MLSIRRLWFLLEEKYEYAKTYVYRRNRFPFLLVLTNVSAQADNYYSGTPITGDKNMCSENLKRQDLPKYINVTLNNILSNCMRLGGPWSMWSMDTCCCSSTETARPALEDSKAVFSNIPLISLPDAPDTYVSFFRNKQIY